MSNSIELAGNMTVTIRAETKHFILCEGNDDEKFLSTYLKSGFLPEAEWSTIQIMPANGVNNIRKMIMLLKNTDGFSKLCSLLVIRDADNDIQQATASVKGAFEAAGLPIPQSEYLWKDDGTIKTAFLLMPTCCEQSQTGTLEDLCWEILSEKQGQIIRKEVEDFISSLEAESKRAYIHRNKALLHTYFSSTEQLIAASIGRAAESGAFNWTSERLTPLASFIKSMI